MDKTIVYSSNKILARFGTSMIDLHLISSYRFFFFLYIII